MLTTSYRVFRQMECVPRYAGSLPCYTLWLMLFLLRRILR